MDPLDLKRSIVLVAVLGFLIATMLIPFHQTIKGPCYTRPGAVWSLSRNGAGQITTSWERNYFNAGAPQVLMQFERPDFVEVEFVPNLYDGARVQSGDTIAYIESREGSGRMDILEATVDLNRLERDALLSGARQVDINVAEAELKRAQAAFSAFEPELKRVQSLHDAGLVSDSLLDVTKGRYDVLEADVRVAEASLDALKAGSRPEDIAVASKEIELSKRELASSSRLLGKREAITAPINGRVRFRGNPEELIRIEMMDTLAVLAAIPETAVSLLKPGQKINIMLRADKVPERVCSLFRIDFGRPEPMVAYAIGLLDNRKANLQPGMTGNVSLPIGKTTFFQGLKAKFNF